jgi:hypothetical protein
VDVSISYAQQCAELPACKDVRPSLGEVNSQVLRGALKRVDLAFSAFFRRCKAGENQGYPRYRSHARYDSQTFKQYGNSFSLSQDGKLLLSKLGQVKLVMHRPLKGRRDFGHCQTHSNGQVVRLDLHEMSAKQAQLLLAGMAGLFAAAHPLAACKIEGIAADPSAIVELLVKEKLMLNPKEGQKGIAPLALMRNPQKHIHYGYGLVGAEREVDLLPAREQVLERLEKAGFLSRSR